MSSEVSDQVADAEACDDNFWSTWGTKLAEATSSPVADPELQTLHVESMSGESLTFDVKDGCMVRDLIRDVAGALRASRSSVKLLWNTRVLLSSEPLAAFIGMTLNVVLLPPPRAVTCSIEDCALRVWDLDMRTCLGTLEGHCDGVLDVCTDFQAQQALSSAADGCLCMWDLQTLTCVGVLEKHLASANVVQADFGVKRALSGGDDCRLLLWDLEKLVCIGTLDVVFDAPGWRGADTRPADERDGCVVALSADLVLHRAISGCTGGLLHVWDLQAMVCTGTLGDYVNTLDPDWGIAMAVKADFVEKRAVLGRANALYLWDLEAMSCLVTLASVGVDAQFVHVSVKFSAGLIVAGNLVGDVCVINLERMVELGAQSKERLIFLEEALGVCKPIHVGEEYTALGVDLEAHYCIVGYKNGALKIFDLQKGLLKGSLYVFGKKVVVPVPEDSSGSSSEEQEEAAGEEDEQKEENNDFNYPVSQVNAFFAWCEKL